MLPKLYTETEIALALHRERRWLLDWLREHPTDVHGQPFYYQLGKSKRFSGDDVVRLIDHILTLEEGEKSSDEGWVYFIDGGEHIKIGFSRSLDNRVISIKSQNVHGAKLLHAQPGTFKTEKVLHRYFRDLRVRGEWFRKDPKIFAYIEQRKAIA